MKRLPIGIGVLLSLLALGFWVGRTADRIHGAVAADLEEAAQAQNWEEAASADAAWEKWEEHRGLSAAITDHTALDEIEAGFAQLQVYRRQGDLTHYTATCARLSQLIAALQEGHELSWQNVL